MSSEQKGRLISKAIKELLQKDILRLSHNELRIIIALERAVARLQSHKKLSKHLVFKGGFVLLKTTDTNRFTRDLDALAHEITKKGIPAIIAVALSEDLDDGLWFGDVLVEEILGQEEYGGVRINCAFQIGEPPKEMKKVKKLSRIHIDIGFGDDIPKELNLQKMRSVIPFEKSVSWYVYPLEYIFSEKLETVFQRASINSRAKDIYDLVLLYPICSSKRKLSEAIERTFKRRGTLMPTSFYKEAKLIDTTILKSAWNSVQLSEGAIEFDDYWKKFLILLQVIDQR